MTTKPYRKAIVAVFQRPDGKVLLGKRSDTGYWQFPQGGVDSGEDYEKALYREMQEEIGCDVFDVLKETQNQICYDFPKELKANIAKQYRGQSQKWFLCRLKMGFSPDLKKASCDEFVELGWFKVSFALASIIAWKKDSYKKALEEFGLL